MTPIEPISDPIFVDGMPIIFDPAEVLQGTPGDDVLQGTRSLTIIFGDSGDDRIVAGDVASQVFGDDGNDVIQGSIEDDRLSGGLGQDQLLGGDGNDVLYGDQDDDELFGGEGDDVLFGGLGRDRLQGGSGADGFVLNFDARSTNRILDFEDGVDKLGVTGEGFSDPDPDAVVNLAEELTIKQRGSGTVIKQDSHTIAVLANVDATTITNNDFAPIIIAQ